MYLLGLGALVSSDVPPPMRAAAAGVADMGGWVGMQIVAEERGWDSNGAGIVEVPTVGGEFIC